MRKRGTINKYNKYEPNESDVREQFEVEREARALSRLSRVAIERPGPITAFGHYNRFILLIDFTCRHSEISLRNADIIAV